LLRKVRARGRFVLVHAIKPCRSTGKGKIYVSVHIQYSTDTQILSIPNGMDPNDSNLVKIKFTSEEVTKTRRLRVFDNRVLRRVFGPKRDEVTGEWRKLHNEELNDLYSVPNIVRVVKSRRMRWAGHVARMGGREGCTGCW
jgi:hypothetical protein